MHHTMHVLDAPVGQRLNIDTEFLSVLFCALYALVYDYFPNAAK